MNEAVAAGQVCIVRPADTITGLAQSVQWWELVRLTTGAGSSHRMDDETEPRHATSLSPGEVMM